MVTRFHSMTFGGPVLSRKYHFFQGMQRQWLFSGGDGRHHVWPFCASDIVKETFGVNSHFLHSSFSVG